MPKKSTKTAAKTKAVDGFALDQSKSQASGVDPKVAENKRKEQELQKALIGYAKWDFLAHPVKFGTWNMRALNASEVQKILDGFGVVGCNRFSKEHLIPLVVKKEYIKESTYDDEFPDETDLRSLKLETNIPIGYQVAAASGQHRVAALKRWVQNQTSKLKSLEKEAKRVKQAGSDEHGDLDAAHYNDTLKPNLDNVKAILDNYGYWGVAIYDADLASVESLTYLSTNQRIHVYKETPEEGLIQKYKEMMSQTNPEKRKPEPSSVTKGSVFKQWELLTQDYVKKLLGYLLDLGPHFVHSKSFKLGHFHEDMMSSYGGILAYVCIRSIERLRMCFNKVDIDRDTVVELEESLKDEETRGEAKKQLHKILTKLRSAKFLPDAITPSHMQLLNEAFEKHYDIGSTTSYQIGNSEFGYRTISSYRQDATAAVRQAVSNLEGNTDLNALDPIVVAAMRSAEYKVRLVLLAKWTGINMFSDFPLFTRSFYIVLRRNLRMIQRSLLEISSWLTPYIRLSHLHTKDWMPGSPTADMLRALLAHQAYDIDNRQQVVATIVHSIFDSYALFLNFEGQLASTYIPAPPARQNELEALFGGDSAAVGVTKNSNRKGKGKSTGSDAEDELADFIDDDDDDDVDEEEDGGDYTPLSEEQRKDNRAKRLRTRKEAAYRFKNLSKEVSAAVTELVSAKKVTPSSVQVEFGSVWSRSSRLADDTTLDLFRGQGTLAFHTFEWSSMLGSSRARSMRNLARIIIYQHAMTQYYLPRILENPDGAAASIRYIIESRLAPYLDTSFATRPVQSRISGAGLVIPSKTVIIWADNMKYSSNISPKTYSLSLDEELKAARFVDIRARQANDLQRVVNSMTSSHIISADKFRFKEARDFPRIDEGVLVALQEFVEVVQINCYRQRHPEAASDIESEDFSLPVAERLQVTIRGLDDDDDDDADHDDDDGHTGHASGFILRCREEIAADEKDAVSENESLSTGTRQGHAVPRADEDMMETEQHDVVSGKRKFATGKQKAHVPANEIEDDFPAQFDGIALSDDASQSDDGPTSNRAAQRPPKQWVVDTTPKMIEHSREGLATQHVRDTLQTVAKTPAPSAPAEPTEQVSQKTLRRKSARKNMPVPSTGTDTQNASDNAGQGSSSTNDLSRKRGVSDTSTRTLRDGKKRYKRNAEEVGDEEEEEDITGLEHQFA